MRACRAPPVRSFLCLLPIALVGAMAMWMLLRPVLDSAVASFAQVLVRAFEYPRVTRLVVVDGRAEVRRSDLRTDSAIPTVSLTEVHFNTIVLVALYLALPKPFSRRQLERLLMGWSILYLTQTLNLVFHVKCLYALGLGEWSQLHYSEFARNSFAFLRHFTDLPGRFSFPFLVWLAFNWDVVMGMLERAEDAGEASRSRPRQRSSRSR